MSKKYKRKPCVYCGSKMAETADHIFARGFFLENRRGNLPQAPACLDCNKRKSSLEHYLQPVFAFGGRHTDAKRNLSQEARRKLERDRKLHRELTIGYEGASVPIEWEKVVSWFRFIARGLIWYHWKVYLDEKTHSLTVVSEAEFSNVDDLISQAKSERRVSADLGDSTFVYEGAQTHDDPQSTVWKLSIYGQMGFGNGYRTNSAIVAYTKPR